MSYLPSWTGADPVALLPAIDSVRMTHLREVQQAIARRQRLTFWPAGAYDLSNTPPRDIALAPLAQDPPGGRSLRGAVAALMQPAAGGVAGDPPTPVAMQWLWPVAGPDEGKILLPVAADSEREVGLFQKLSGIADWTDAQVAAGQCGIRAVHVNELRRSVELLRRGRWRLPLYLSAGMLSSIPDAAWFGGRIANTGAQELRTLGFAQVAIGQGAAMLGLRDVHVRQGTGIDLLAQENCTVEVYRCLRGVSFSDNPPTWNQFDPAGDGDWSAPGGAGVADAVLLGSIDLPVGQVTTFSSPALAQAVAAMIPTGDEQPAPANFMLRRADVSAGAVEVAADLVVEFDLAGPPN